MSVFNPILNDPRLARAAEWVASGPEAITLTGLWGSSAPIVAGAVAARLGRPLLLVAAHPDDADAYRDDIETALGRLPELFPQLEGLPGEVNEDDELLAERVRLCTALAEAGASKSAAEAASRPMIVAPIIALLQPVPSRTALVESSVGLSVGAQVSPEVLEGWLVEQGFSRCDQVELPGDFARRGGIIDVFSHAYTNPVRVEFFGDVIESIRLFDAGTQRSLEALGGARLPARRLSADVGQTGTFLSYLPDDAIIAFHEPLEIQEIGRAFLRRVGERVGLSTVESVFRQAQKRAQLHLQRFGDAGPRTIDLHVRSLPQFEPRLADGLRGLAELARESRVHVLCDNAAEMHRFGEVLAEAARPIGPGLQGSAAPDAVTTPAGNRVGESAAEIELTGEERAGLATNVTAHTGVLHRGFCWTPADSPDSAGCRAYVPHHELFHRYRQRRTLRRVAPARPIDSFFDLNTGDLVVHTLHGIGRFVGLKSLDRQDRRDEYLAIEFADGAVVHVSTSQIHLVQKYIGSFRGKPKLSKLGGLAWKRTKERVAESVTDLAAELLALQARRATESGIAYPLDTEWQREFEAAFPYQETEDQLRALEEIKADMRRGRPMDRLICGDVGFGKTELAIRAAFKAVEYGKQVAVLVPTTVLAEQHYQTFRERLADYPFVVEGLSRFRTRAEQARIVEQVNNRQIDILIGTHRLLSADVKFADLGLVIIDEEQRFGVEAKERLKTLRATVDVLTLSATPIPRTLHMSMLGMRDISSLTTPPADRRSIVTQVRMWDDALIRDALVRELNREGQAYFVHNFVHNIDEVANRVRSIVPDARVVVGHGQMSGPELEAVMLQFIRREADVLVSTNIIESGLDIPSANTIFINRAERFGLADLHQLRGRVGRSKHRAYAYLLLSPQHPVTEIAAKRLKAIEHYSDLGAGFQIAMRDLEIRGAGNILGPEQSGHIEAVGYELYCQLLEQAVRRLKKEPAERQRIVNLELGISASIPRTYIRSERQRMEVYKRLAACLTPDDVTGLERDLRDAYGAPPEDMMTLLHLAEIRTLAAGWGIRSIVVSPPDVIFSIDDLRQVEPLFASGSGSPRVPDGNTVHWRLPKRYLEASTLVHVLRRQLSGNSQEAAAPARPARGASG